LPENGVSKVKSVLRLAMKRRREIPKRGNDEMMFGITITK
jgi:hypothetical protein